LSVDINSMVSTNSLRYMRLTRITESKRRIYTGEKRSNTHFINLTLANKGSFSLIKHSSLLRSSTVLKIQTSN
jgi:hypothetical protein